jgi:hypothetical protein
MIDDIGPWTCFKCDFEYIYTKPKIIKNQNYCPVCIHNLSNESSVSFGVLVSLLISFIVGFLSCGSIVLLIFHVFK